MVLIVIVLLAGSVLGRLAWRSWHGREVTLAEVGEGRVVAAVYATGRIDSDQRATVRARVAAPLETVEVGSGQAVRAGQEVARQDGTALELAIERAKRELEAARASAAESEDAAVRAKHLVDSGLLAEDAWVRSREGAKQAVAQRAALESALALAEEQASWVVLRAPISGTVSELLHRAGDALREGDDVLTIVDLDNAYLRVAVDERDIGRVTPGQAVRMVFDAYPDRRLEGQVWRIVPAVDRLTKSSDVLVSLPTERPPLQLDLTATVNIVTEVVPSAVVVRRDALEGSGARQRAFVVGPDARARVRTVELGACDEERCQVLSGLARGDRVVAPLPAGLKDGERVAAR